MRLSRTILTSKAAIAFVLAAVLVLCAATTLLQINQGGTGATTAPGAFLNLAPAGTAVGDLIVCTHVTGGACDTWAKCPGNAGAAAWLHESSGACSWTSPPGSGTVYPGTGIAVSTGSAWGTSYTLGTGLTLSGSAITTVGQQPAQISASFIGVPANGQIILLIPLTFAVTVPTGCTNSHLDGLVAVTASTTFTMYYLTGGIGEIGRAH